MTGFGEKKFSQNFGRYHSKRPEKKCIHIFSKTLICYQSNDVQVLLLTKIPATFLITLL